MCSDQGTVHDQDRSKAPWQVSVDILGLPATAYSIPPHDTLNSLQEPVVQIVQGYHNVQPMMYVQPYPRPARVPLEIWHGSVAWNA